MHTRLAAVILFCCFICACDQKGKYFDPNSKDTIQRILTHTDSTVRRTVQPPAEAEGLQLFCNQEIVSYCIWLPLHDFKEDFHDPSTAKAQHKFLLREDSSSFTSIELQGFTIDKKNNYNVKVFYERDKAAVEEGGLGIDTSYMDEARHFYLIKGHLPNYNNMRFVQLNWILEDRIAVYFNYDEKEEALWQQRLATIIAKGIQSN